MGEVFFNYRNHNYLYDLENCRLYEIVRKQFKEVKNHKVFNDIRFHSKEISRETALDPFGDEI